MTKWLAEVGDVTVTQPLIGVLGLQGAYQAHQTVLQGLGCRTAIVRKPHELNECQALVMPGGESTTMGLLMQRFTLIDALIEFGQQGKPMFVTCAGLILLAKEIVGSDQLRLNLLDIAVERNAYGRQQESFQTDLTVVNLPEQDVMRAVFIRAPKIARLLSDQVTVLASYQDSPVLVQQQNILGACFHPELSGHSLVHEHFLTMIEHATG